MNAGLPSAGIGVTFYLLATVAMPFFEIWRLFKRESGRLGWRFILRQLSIATNIILGISLANLFFDIVAPRYIGTNRSFTIFGQVAKLAHISNILIMPAILIAVLAVIEVASLIHVRSRTR
ncbi:MAG: hypothetical protein WCT32_04730 [Patescibacteria group bacterium]